jgi:hypothetical protein
MNIVANGRNRLEQTREYKTREYKARVLALRTSIRARYATQLASGGLLQRWLLRWRMEAEFRRERKKLRPSASALYLRSSTNTGLHHKARAGSRLNING